MIRWHTPFLVALFASAAAAQSTSAPATRRMPMRVIDTPYYTLHTDVSDVEAREADLRMTRMFEEYQRRTAGFSGQVKQKFPFFLFRNERDYLAAGGPEGSDGVFIRSDGKRLMAIAGEKTDTRTWSTVQHEAFHQFADAVIASDLPAWANEGLADYFGEAMWTGDNFVSGLIPTRRMKDVQDGIRRGTFKPFKVLMNLSYRDWNGELSSENYDEGWSMIHFLANADGGKYQTPFLQYMQQVSHGITTDNAWANVFGRDIDGFQARYSAYWMGMQDGPTRAGYLKALVLTETSFLARAYLLKQTFKDPSTYFKEYKPPEFGVNRDLWLPPELFANYADIVEDVGKWTFTTSSGSTLPKLTLQLDDGSKLTGSFTLSNGKVAKVDIAVTAAPPTSRPAGR